MAINLCFICGDDRHRVINVETETCTACTEHALKPPEQKRVSGGYYCDFTMYFAGPPPHREYQVGDGRLFVVDARPILSNADDFSKEWPEESHE